MYIFTLLEVCIIYTPCLCGIEDTKPDNDYALVMTPREREKKSAFFPSLTRCQCTLYTVEEAETTMMKWTESRNRSAIVGLNEEDDPWNESSQRKNSFLNAELDSRNPSRETLLRLSY